MKITLVGLALLALAGCEAKTPKTITEVIQTTEYSGSKIVGLDLDDDGQHDDAVYYVNTAKHTKLGYALNVTKDTQPTWVKTKKIGDMPFSFVCVPKPTTNYNNDITVAFSKEKPILFYVEKNGSQLSLLAVQPTYTGSTRTNNLKDGTWIRHINGRSDLDVLEEEYKTSIYFFAEARD